MNEKFLTPMLVLNPDDASLEAVATEFVERRDAKNTKKMNPQIAPIAADSFSSARICGIRGVGLNQTLSLAWRDYVALAVAKRE